MTEFLFFHVKTTKYKEKKILSTLERKKNTAALIGISLYSVYFIFISFNFLHFLNALLNMPIVLENKTVLLYIMCIFDLIFNNKDQIMTKIFIFPWPKYPPYFFIFCNLERLCLYNMEIILAVLLRHNSKINMTKDRDKIVI